MKRVLSMYKRNWIIILIVIVMTILNPTYSDFKEYTGLTGRDSEHLHKKYNFLILSIYKNDVNEHNYLAILMNFIDITQHKINTESIVTKDSTGITVSDSTFVDTTYMSNSTRKIKVVFPDGSFAIIDSTGLKSALLSGAKVVKKK